MKPTISAVIFDCDGTILDTLKLYYEALTKIVPPPYPRDLTNYINGRSEIEVAKIIVKYFNLQMTPEEFLLRREEILKSLLPHSELMDGVDNIIRELHKRGIPMAVATSCTRNMHRIKIQNQKEIFGLFRATICGDEVKVAKPEPEIFQKASKELGDFNPENVLVFEDAYNGIKAANKAGMNSVFIATEDPEHVQEALDALDAKPNCIINTYKEFCFDNFNWVPKQ